MLQTILEKIVSDDKTHAKWLNTLSYMENCGARKISKFEHKTDVDLIILKHAAEEHRHAYYLKKMISKVSPNSCKKYEPQDLLAGVNTKHYLDRLDVFAARYLKQNFGLSGYELKFAAYLFVTYAIEVRADYLYPIYQDILKKTNSKVSVNSIIIEEEGHLEEMIHALKQFSPEWDNHAQKIIDYEQELFSTWLNLLQIEIGSLELTVQS